MNLLPGQAIAALHLLPQGVALFDSGLRLVFANPALLRALDLPADALPAGMAQPVVLRLVNQALAEAAPHAKGQALRRIDVPDGGQLLLLAETAPEPPPAAPAGPSIASVLSALIDHLGDGVVVCDKTRHIVAANARAAALFGQTAEFLAPGRALADVLAALAAQGVLGRPRAALRRMHRLLARDLLQPGTDILPTRDRRVLELRWQPAGMLAPGGALCLIADATLARRLRAAERQARMPTPSPALAPPPDIAPAEPDAAPDTEEPALYVTVTLDDTPPDEPPDEPAAPEATEPEAAEPEEAEPEEALPEPAGLLDHAQRFLLDHLQRMILQATEDAAPPDAPAPVDVAATAVADAAQNLRSLLAGLHDVTQLATGDAKLADDEIDIAGLLRMSVVAAEAAATAAGLALGCAVSDNLPMLRGDAARLRNMLGQLLRSAIAATPAGGAVQMDAALTGAGELVLRIEDTGAPDRFPPRDPTLYMARALMAAHGGRLLTHTEDGGMLLLLLPAARLGMDAPMPALAAADADLRAEFLGGRVGAGHGIGWNQEY